MSFEYVSMVGKNKLEKIRKAVVNNFRGQDGYGYSVTVGFEREVVSTVNGEIIFNNFDHALDSADKSITLGRLGDSPDEILNHYLALVKEQHLDEENYQREKAIYDVYHSDILAYD